MPIQLKERFRQWYHREDKEPKELPLFGAASERKGEVLVGKPYTLHSLCQLAELLESKGMLTTEEVLWVFDLQDNWEVMQ